LGNLIAGEGNNAGINVKNLRKL